MSQQLLDLIGRLGGGEAVAAMAAKVGLTPEQVQSGMAALMPAVAGGMSKAAATGGEALDAAAAPAAMVADHPASVASDSAVANGSDLVSQIFGGAAGTSAVTAHAAQASGLSAGVLAQLLPMVTTLAAGTLAGKASGPHGASGTLLGMLDVNKDGNPLDDIMGFAGKLFGKG